MGQALLDLDYSEDSRAEVDLNVVMNQEPAARNAGHREGRPLQPRQQDALLDLAEAACSNFMRPRRQALAEAPN
jgi:ribonuclease PH